MINFRGDKDLRGVALSPSDGNSDGDTDFWELIDTAMEIAYPAVIFCSGDELNTFVRGNGMTDVSDLVANPFWEEAPEEIQAWIDVRKESDATD